ncbi:hypothetical protein PACTADRAFT_3079 [Pachysolen tannophilus NRRL Y-2460]|uniref:Uncharacterized protein n=1 Tax=Pachysolen tannophilus NRRL Y-2460 TaxID=669874 RepID=A0A1E4TUH4_PACTA|nr:hypothetical protein PACTADRAFT_3079 [Pachysolen tannophilus NRRL Y-2460]
MTSSIDGISNELYQTNINVATTPQHQLTLQNYNLILNSANYNATKLSPPPLIYGRDKRVLIEFVKFFSLKHGYKVVTNKNDSKRVILLCSRHGVNKSNSNNGTNLASSKTRELGQQFNDAQKHKCQCPFKAELQYKQRKKLWILKPIVMNHNHDEIITLPVTVDNSTSSTPDMTLGGKKINRKYTVSNFCQELNHLDCCFKLKKNEFESDFKKYLGLDEKEEIILNEEGLRVIETELIDNNDNTGRGAHGSNSSSSGGGVNSGGNGGGSSANPDLLSTIGIDSTKLAKRENSLQKRGRKRKLDDGPSILKPQEIIITIECQDPSKFFVYFPKFNIDDLSTNNEMFNFKYLLITNKNLEIYDFHINVTLTRSKNKKLDILKEYLKFSNDSTVNDENITNISKKIMNFLKEYTEFSENEAKVLSQAEKSIVSNHSNSDNNNNENKNNDDPTDQQYDIAEVAAEANAVQAREEEERQRERQKGVNNGNNNPGTTNELLVDPELTKSL